MKKLLKKLAAALLVVACVTAYSATAFAAEQNEFVLTVTPEFSGEITEELQAIGVTSLEKIFETDDTIMYVAKAEGDAKKVASSLESLSQVKSVEENQTFSTSTDGDTFGSQAVDNEYLLSVSPEFTGELTDELKVLGITSLEKCFDVDGTTIYLAKSQEPSENMIEKLQNISGVNYAERNQMMNVDDVAVPSELIISVKPGFVGEVTDQFKALGVVSLEKIFDSETTVLYLAKLENADADVAAQVSSIPDVIYAEASQNGSIAEDAAKVSKAVLLNVSPEFSGELTNEMKNLGVTSLEKIFDVGDTIIYLASVENPTADILVKMQGLTGVKNAEFDKGVTIADPQQSSKSVGLYIGIGSAAVILLGGLIAIVGKRRGATSKQ